MLFLEQLLSQFDPKQPLRVVISDMEMAKELMVHYPHLERIMVDDDIEKYSYFGYPDMPVLDLAILDGLPTRVAERIWGRIRVGGAVIILGDDRPLRFLQGGPQIYWKQHWVIVSGIHRGATMFMARTLQQAGVKVGHQSNAQDGIVGGAMAATIHPIKTRAIHQIRDPYMVIESLVPLMGRISSDYPSNVFEQQCNESLLHIAMRYWLWIDDMARLQELWTYRVEIIHIHWEEICERLGIPKCHLPNIPITTNARSYKAPSLTWHMMLDEDRPLALQIKDRARQYGYGDRK